MTLEQLCQQARPLIVQTGAFIRAELGKVNHQDIVTKALNSLVSYVDQTAEKQLVAGLNRLLPEATFLTEEETVDTKHSDLQWIIDPLDGTTNFLHQLPVFSVSVALQKQGKIVLGIVYEINRDECFYAWAGGGAYCNDHPIRVSRNTALADSLIATGFPYYDYDRIKTYLQVLAELMKGTRGIRRFGSAAVDLAYTACGRFDGFFEYSLNAWDVAAGILLVQEAGGVVTDFSGGDNYLFGGEMIACSKGIQEEFAKTVSPLAKG